MPTLEIHRGRPIVEQVQYLISTKLIDDVIIGNACASDEEFAQVAKLNQQLPEFLVQFTPGTTELEKQTILDNLHFNRGDINSYAIRSTFVKLKYRQVNIPVNNAKHQLTRGMVTIGNDDFGQYKAEVNIVKQPMENADELKNVVATIVPNNQVLIDFIQPWGKFKFIDADKF
ncbi:DUF871 family protein [Pediococcus acidilactici]